VLGRFSSAEVRKLNTHREGDKEKENKKVKQRNAAIEKVKRRVVARRCF